MYKVSHGKLNLVAFSVAYAVWMLFLFLASLKGPAPLGETDTKADVLLLTSTRTALDQFRQISGAYPQTFENWILLKEDDIDAVIIDPGSFARVVGKSAVFANQTKGIIYRSDGLDFKLLFIHPKDMNDIRQVHPLLVDPARTAYSRAMLFGGWEAKSASEVWVAKMLNPMIKEDPYIRNPLFGVSWGWGFWTDRALLW